MCKESEPKVCSRCGASIEKGWSVSYFNTDRICLKCKDEEQTFPEYPEAKAAERAEILKKNYNFEGIGLPEKYKKMYAARRTQLTTSETEYDEICFEGKWFSEKEDSECKGEYNNEQKCNKVS